MKKEVGLKEEPEPTSHCHGLLSDQAFPLPACQYGFVPEAFVCPRLVPLTGMNSKAALPGRREVIERVGDTMEHCYVFLLHQSRFQQGPSDEAPAACNSRRGQIQIRLLAKIPRCVYGFAKPSQFLILRKCHSVDSIDCSSFIGSDLQCCKHQLLLFML